VISGRSGARVGSEPDTAVCLHALRACELRLRLLPARAGLLARRLEGPSADVV